MTDPEVELEAESLAGAGGLRLLAEAPELAAAGAALARWILPHGLAVRAVALASANPGEVEVEVPWLGRRRVEVAAWRDVDPAHGRSGSVCALDRAALAAGRAARALDWTRGDAPADGRAMLDALASRLLGLAGRLAARAYRPDAGPAAPTVAVLGGSGFYDLPGLSEVTELDVPTPLGPPSDRLREGRLAGVRVLFLARHGRQHQYLPNEVNVRANLLALKWAGATHVLSVSAVGSLREEIAPGHVVVPAQFVDRTVARPMTLFGDGVVAHVSLADPVCPDLAAILAAAARDAGATLHAGATYLNIEGPQFSTRAESRLYRAWGCDVIGMTNLPEARLAREAELCYATLALATDYDCWRDGGQAVQAHDVLAVLRDNVTLARRILARALTGFASGAARACPAASSLDGALFTAPGAIPLGTRVRLAPVLTPWLARQAAV